MHIPDRNIRRAVAVSIKNARATHVIDLCCDTGSQIKYLHRYGIESAMGVDVSENMLKQAWRNELRIDRWAQSIKSSVLSPNHGG